MEENANPVVFSLQSYKEKTQNIVQSKELYRQKRKEQQRERLAKMSVNDHMKIINAVIEGHLGAGYILIRYAVTDLDIDICKVLIETYEKSGWYTNYDPRLYIEDKGYDNERALKEFYERNPDKAKVPGGITISSYKELPRSVYENPPEYRKRPYLHCAYNEKEGGEIDFFIPEPQSMELVRDLLLFGEYIVVELRKLVIPVHKICLHSNSGSGSRLPEFAVDY